MASREGKKEKGTRETGQVMFHRLVNCASLHKGQIHKLGHEGFGVQRTPPPEKEVLS